MEKQERTECIYVHVTPDVKKEFEQAKDNKDLQETIIRSFIHGEKNWLEQEMQGIDESTLKYQAKLLTIKDKFSEAQNKYVEQIEQIYLEAEKTFKKIDDCIVPLQKKTESAFNQIKQLNTSISSISFHQLDGLMNSVERFNGMNEKEKQLILMLIQKQ